MSPAYSDTIRRWAIDMRRAGVLEPADGIGEVGLGEGEAGRRVAVRFTLLVEGGCATSVRYQVFGCGFTIAACAAAADLAEGRPLSAVTSIETGTVAATLGGLPPERNYCAQLAVEALHAAVASARNGHAPVAATVATENDHAPRVSANDPVYRLLVDSPAAPGTAPEDRHLFACLLAVAAAEPYAIPQALGLSKAELDNLLHACFPAVTWAEIENLSAPGTSHPPSVNRELIALLASYLSTDERGCTPAAAQWLAHIVAARSAHAGHLWRAMGLFARQELTAAIHRHLPRLAGDNRQGMRWKRFLYKRLCELSGGVMCKSPDCGACSDYALCFPAAE